MNIFQEPMKAMPPKDNHDVVRSRLEEADKQWLQSLPLHKDMGMSVRNLANPSISK